MPAAVARPDPALDPAGIPSALPGEPLATWSGEGVTIGDVLQSLDDLRRSHERMATRTSVVNLVVATTEPEAAGRARSAMRRLGHHHPGRTIALVCGPDRPDGIDAEVELHEARAEGRSIWWDEVRLDVGGRVCGHIDSVITPLLLAELPLVVWYPSALPSRQDPLPDMAAALLVDARWAGEDEESAPEALPGLVELTRRHVVVDLSWKRLTPWRWLMAGLFDPAPWRPFVAGVVRAEVAAHAGPGRLLAGWLMDRLGLADTSVTLRPAVHASMVLEARRGDRRGRFAVRRPADDPVVHAEALIEGGPALRQRAVLPDHGLTWSLAEALSHLTRDRVYEHAVQAALAVV